MDKVIYSITVIRTKSPISTRCVGYYFDKDEAITAVITNQFDIAELGYYKYAAIHAVPEGIHQIPEDSEASWFEYDRYTQRYGWARKPEQLKGWACVGIG